jgi:hypothetical protein
VYYCRMSDIRVELPPPDPVGTSKRAVEVLRAWQCDGVLHLTMSSGLPTNLFGCAVLLSDITRIIARAENLHPEKNTVAAIQELKHYMFGLLRPAHDEIPPDAPLLITYHDFLRLFHAETDRAAAVLAGSYLESYLADCLKYYFVDHGSIANLFEGAGPLATFAARAGIAFALGLITDETREEIRFITKIRNHFAHHPAETSFSVSPVRDWCARLSLSQQLPDHTPREIYLFAVGGAALQLNNVMLAVRRRTPPEIGGA